MKSLFITLLAFLALSFSAKSQVYDNTIGLRAGGGNYGIGSEISYQHGVSDINRLEAGVGFGSDGRFTRFGVTGAFHWAFEVQNGFSWYVGPGIQGWLYSFNRVLNKNHYINKGSGVGGAIGAQFGVEYDFDKDLGLPFTASLDTRPMFHIVNHYTGFEYNVGLSIRYVF